jgi:hypothetical protein
MQAAAMIFLGFALLGAAFILVSVRVYQVKPDLVAKIFKYALIGGFALAFSIASLAIGFRIDSRHNETYSKSMRSVVEIWGGQISQQPPTFYYEGSTAEQFLDEKTNLYKTRVKTGPIIAGFQEQTIAVSVKKNIRRKGLLDFPGYNLSFTGSYVLKNSGTMRNTFFFHFPLPSNAGNVTGISVKLDGKDYTDDTNLADGVAWSGPLSPGESKSITVQYQAQGTETFLYALAQRSIEIKNLDAKLSTDFDDILIPDNSMAPSSESADSSGMVMAWKAQNLVTGQNIALQFNVPGNYGRVVSKMFLYAPLPIFLFIGFLLIVCAAKQIRLHPLHFLFVLTSFFIYYLLGSYLVSYMHIVAAILVSLAVSGAIALYYTHLIGKGRDIVTGTAIGLGIFQWFFSAAFFFPEHTGFLITVASIIAFIVLVRITAKIDWENKW